MNLILASLNTTHTISEPLFALDELEKRLRLAQLHQEVDVVLVLKGIVEVNDVGMLELHVNFDFTFELSLVPRLLQSVFIYDLSGMRSYRLHGGASDSSVIAFECLLSQEWKHKNQLKHHYQFSPCKPICR